MIEFLLFYPLVTSLLLLFFKKRILNRIVFVLYLCGTITFGICFIAGFNSQVTYLPQLAPYFSGDPLSKLFFFSALFVFAASSIASIRFLSHSSDNRWDTFYTAAFLIFAGSLFGVLFSAHLGLLWVFVELTTLSSALLIYYERTRESLEATWKYIFVCSIGIALAFVGIIMIMIGSNGNDSLFFADLSSNANRFSPFWLKTGFVFILTGFGTKMGLAPMHAWLPDAHSEAPAPASAMLSGSLLNAALMGILRVMVVMRDAGLGSFSVKLLLVTGVISIALSAIFMLRVTNYKRLLAYSSIEHMGIIATGVAVGGVALFAAFLHTIVHSFAKSSLFLTTGRIHHLYDSREIALVDSLMSREKITGVLFVAGALAITAFPPFGTFISEFYFFSALIANKSYILAGSIFFLLTVALFAILRPVLSMTGDKGSVKKTSTPSADQWVPQALLLLLLVVMGLYVPPQVVEIVSRAASMFAGG